MGNLGISVKRDVGVDIAKGIGIILVVWAHAVGPLTSYIDQFHMPFFFFISGLLYRGRDRKVADYTLRKLKALLLPFWWWNFLMYPLFFFLYYRGAYSVQTALKEILEIVFTVSKVPFLGATWFLPALFWCSVIVHIVLHILPDNFKCDLLVLFAGAGIMLIGMNYTLPYRISRVLVCSFFYISGYFYNRYINKKISRKSKNILAVIAGVAFAFIGTVNSVDLGGNVYKFKSLYIIGALCATFCILRLSALLSECRVISRFINHVAYLGANSIDILIWQFLAFRLTIMIQIIIDKLPLSTLTAFPIYDGTGFWWFIYILAGIYGSLLWTYILKHNPLSKQMKKLYMIR
ncbi:MAG: acyltransferase family protein [Clostridia bacterium]|nr:acyltransferase family protein [Clostridia bacterium]